MEACFRDSSLNLRYIEIRNCINKIKEKLNSENRKPGSGQSRKTK